MRRIAVLAAFAAVVSATGLQAQGSGRGRGAAGGAVGRGGMGGGVDGMALRGITLTDAQKSRLEDLRKADRAEMQAGGRQGRPDIEAIRDARQKGDTATANRLMREERAKMEARRDEQLRDVRAILTGDQLPQFDANVAEMKKRQGEMGAGRGGRGAGRRGRPPE